MNKRKFLLVLCCTLMALMAIMAGVSCGKPSSESEGGATSSEILVSFDPCVEIYEGLKANVPLTQKLTKGDLVKEPTIRAMENPNNFTCEGWYTSKDYTVKWNFSTDTVQKSMTLYAKWVQSYSVNYYLTDGETCELKRTVSCLKTVRLKKLMRLPTGMSYLGIIRTSLLRSNMILACRF